MFASLQAPIALHSLSSLPASLALAAQPHVHLRQLDMARIAIYFGMMLWIGLFLKGQSNTGEDFLVAGREMTAWIAGLSFVSANPAVCRSAGSGTDQACAVDAGAPAKRSPSKSASPPPAGRAGNLPEPRDLQVVATGVN